MLVADVAAAGAVALGFGGYLAHFAGTPVILNALLLLVAVGIVAYAGVGESVALALVLTAVEAAGLVFVIVVGVPSWRARRSLRHAGHGDERDLGAPRR